VVCPGNGHPGRRRALENNSLAAEGQGHPRPATIASVAGPGPVAASVGGAADVCSGRGDRIVEVASRAMDTTTVAVLVTIAFSVVGVLGDYFLKLASTREQPLTTGWFYLGFALYASTAFGWVFVMRHLKLATISVLYSVSMILLLTAIGVVLFRESLNYSELTGIALAVVALVLLMRFA
jgi:drug/metabolite transporter (DMT)-like permease